MAASLFIVGALLTQGGSWTLGAVLLGLCGAAKMTYVPLVGLWIVLLGLVVPGRGWLRGESAFSAPPWGRVGWAAGCLVLLLAPWGLKTYLGTGNPVFPFASTLFASYDWSAANETVLRSSVGMKRDILAKLTVLPGLWTLRMRQSYLVLLLLLPGLLWLGRQRWVAATCVLAQLVTFWGRGDARYLLPSVWMLLFLAAHEVQRLRGGVKTVVVLLLVGTSLMQISSKVKDLRMGWRDVLIPREALLLKHLTTYEEAIRELGARKPVRRLLSVGERLTYRLPGRVLYGGQIGETPLIWKLVKEADSVERLRVKFKQLGATYMLYNYVSAEWLAIRYQPFGWGERMLDLYQEYGKRHFGILARSEGNDYLLGGFYLYQIHQQPLDPVPATIWYLPGTEQLLLPAKAFDEKKRYREMVAACLKVLQVLPDVGHIWNEVGHAYMKLGDMANAYKYLKPFAAQGMVDMVNLAELGLCAVRLGDLDLAERMLPQSLLLYPVQVDPVRVGLAQLRYRRAVVDGQSRRFDSAKTWLEEAEEFLKLVPENTAKATMVECRRTLAGIAGLRGDICAGLRERKQAANHYREACRIFPEDKGAARWRKLAKELDPPRLFLRTNPGP